MKTKEEIEQLSLLKYPKFSSDPYNPEQDDEYYERLIWIEGYTQCQEDIRELLLEIKNNWTGDKLIGGTYEKICNSLNKQD